MDEKVRKSSQYSGKTTVLFTNSQKLSSQLNPYVYTEDNLGQEVQLNNEGKVSRCHHDSSLVGHEQVEDEEGADRPRAHAATRDCREGF